MKSKYTFLIFLIIPLILFIVSQTFKESQGPYFTHFQYDPGYVYLINALNLSQLSGYGVGHVDHPGTPLQMIGAIVIKIYFYFNGEEINMVQDVLFNPEKYLDIIDFVLIILNCVGLFFLGYVSYKVYSDIIITFLFQLSVFSSIYILYLFAYPFPENFLFFVTIIFISVLILFVNDSMISSKRYLWYLIVLGVITGLGISTKLTFFPLAVIPLILFRGIKFKLLFLIITAASFLIFVIPAISSDNIRYFAQWIYKLSVNTKKYGSGQPDIINLYLFLHNLKKIFLTHYFFDAAYFSVLVSLIFCLKPKLKNFISRFKKNTSVNSGSGDISDVSTENYNCRLAMGFFIAMTIQILIVAKHFEEYYMFPVLVISVFAVFISISILSDRRWLNLTKRKRNIAYYIIIFAIIVYGSINFYKYNTDLKVMTKESNKLLDYLKENPDNSLVINCFHVTNREIGLFYAMFYAGSQAESYKAILNTKYPSSFAYFDKIYTFSNDPDKIENSVKSNDKITLIYWDEFVLNQFLEYFQKQYGTKVTSYEKKFSNTNGEKIYEIKYERLNNEQ